MANEQKIPSFQGDIDIIPKISKVSLKCSNGKWFLVFSYKDEYCWVYALDAQCSLDKIASMFSIKPTETNIKMKQTIHSSTDKFWLKNVKGGIVIILVEWSNSKSYEPPFGVQFVCNIPNTKAIPERSLKEGKISFDYDFPKEITK